MTVTSTSYPRLSRPFLFSLGCTSNFSVMPLKFIAALPFLSLTEQKQRREQTLAAIMNLPNEPKCTEAEGKTNSIELRVSSRRQRSIELRKLGAKIPQIQERIFEETGVMWSYMTIRRDLSSVTAAEELDELRRQQDADIAFEQDRKVRLEYRDRQIERLMPRKSLDIEVNVATKVEVQKNVTVTQLLQRYQQFISGTIKTNDICSNNPEQPVPAEAAADTQATGISVT